MRISGSTPPLPPVATQARAIRRPEADVPAQAPAAPAPVPESGTPETEAPAESAKAHGLVRAAEHSHRSDVAALRQWINHPDLRNDPLPARPVGRAQGNGFRNAVAAYEAVIAIGNPPPSTDADPITTDPTPIVTDPAPVTNDPDPVTTDPAPVVSDPDPVVSEPAPVVPNPTPVVSDPDPLLDPLLPQEPTPGAEAE